MNVADSDCLPGKIHLSRGVRLVSFSPAALWRKVWRFFFRRERPGNPLTGLELFRRKIPALANGSDVQRIKDVHEALFVSNDNAASRHHDELFVRNGEFAPIRCANDKRLEPICNLSANLFQIHVLFFFQDSEFGQAIRFTQTSPSAAAERGLLVFHALRDGAKSGGLFLRV